MIKLKEFNVKTILAIYIVVFGMSSIVFIDMSDTLHNSIINIMIMVVSYHFGSSSGSTKKDEVIQNMSDKKL